MARQYLALCDRGRRPKDKKHAAVRQFQKDMPIRNLGVKLKSKHLDVESLCRCQVARIQASFEDSIELQTASGSVSIRIRIVLDISSIFTCMLSHFFDVASSTSDISEVIRLSPSSLKVRLAFSKEAYLICIRPSSMRVIL